MTGEFRLYNVGQDTKFKVGGDMETSYLYSLGYETTYHGDDLPIWAAHLKYEASELYDKVSPRVEQPTVCNGGARFGEIGIRTAVQISRKDGAARHTCACLFPPARAGERSGRRMGGGPC